MCGRFALTADADVIQQSFNLDSLPETAPRYNIAPSQSVPIITNQQPKELSIVEWGLIPSWAKDTKMRYKMINARAETVDSKPSYRTPFKYRRCLIPTTGFYEWVKAEDGKQPYHIYVEDQDIFSFAGLWEIWNSPEGDEVWTCTIITTEASPEIAHLHHRMPVILSADDRAAWLDNDAPPADHKALLQSYQKPNLAFYPVSKAVNNVHNDNPSLIERDDPPRQQSLF